MPDIHISGVWKNVQGPSDQSSFVGLGGSRLSWGTPAESLTSSYEFEGGSNRLEIDGDAFVLGTFTHHNYPIITPFERFSVDLDITATVTNGPSSDITVTFNHYESPNRGPVAAWADEVSLAPLSPADPWRVTQAVTIAGVACDMIFEGFYSHSTGQLSRTYRSPENDSNQADIHVRLTSYQGPK